MRLTLEICLSLAILWWASVSHQQGYQTAWSRAREYYNGNISRQVDMRVAGFRRVQQIREKSAYRKGWDKCVDALALPQSE